MPSKDLPRDVGAFIRDLRRNAQISLRQLAEQAGVSNPYLSQVERGLRKPSAEVLQQLANALRVSTPVMYLRAGLLEEKEGHGVLTAIAADSDLTIAQKQSLSQIYETFRRENARHAEAEAESAKQAEAASEAAAQAARAADAAAAAAGRAAGGPTQAPTGWPGDAEATPTPAAETAKPVVKKTAKKAVKKAAPRAAEEEN
ncbi:helix-turn-helix transcriptional regulator [Asanoa sp. WMMD1127]|uniref:helix-turn-helix domain-containing protein n=1 Tax=Asanoa sp. WMMD1127 TaxID=3016107 RepID=UPI00241810FB|nr:helix-turn-helix transcriptional regulator [Asanoa sp. WMMD1127]MDG4822567.1 helix-turn-helix transcriptional regulator [Asanoa sp. WMMD1127]